MTTTWVPKNKVDYDARVALVGLSLKYAGCETKEEFFQSLLDGKIQYKELSEQRLDSINKSMHFLKERSKYSDTFCNDRYATIDDKKFRNEHDLLLQLTNEAMVDYKTMKGNNDGLIDLQNDEIGIVSGCLSFPRDNQQGQLSLLYQSHVEKKFRELFPNDDVIVDGSPWSARPESKIDPAVCSEQELNEFASDLRQRTDPASYVAEKLNLQKNTVSYSIDAACATSLYVLRLAQEHLVHRQCDVVFCGATTLPDPFFILSGFSTFQAIPVQGTPQDISAPWRKGSTGLTPGEGGCIVVMKRLEDAVRDNDHIYGTLLACGINNAGCGLPLKPLLDSELSCLRETYSLIDFYYSESNKLDDQLDRWIQYVECHATGTSQGDQVELDAMKKCYAERNQALPIFGSSKGNFGHTLVAAGFAGMCKLLLSMQNGMIPPTPGLFDDSGANQKMHENVVCKKQSWPDFSNGSTNSYTVRRGALSAFGFGGTNAHAVFEKYSTLQGYRLSMGNKIYTPLTAHAQPVISILGMDCSFGTAESLNEFESAVYNHRPVCRKLPNKRWRFLTKDKEFHAKIFGEYQDEIMAGFIEKFAVDFKSLRTPLAPEDLLIPQQLLCLTVMDNAVEQSRIPDGSRTAVLVGLGTDLELYRHKGRVMLKERLARVISSAKVTDPTLNNLLDYVHDRGTSTSYTSYIGNLIATRHASKHGFTGPSFTVTESENSSLRCLQIADLLIKSGSVDYIVIAGVDMNCSGESYFVKSRNYCLDGTADKLWFGEGAGCVVVSSSSQAKSINSRPYANIVAYSSDRFSPKSAILKAHDQAKKHSTQNIIPDFVEVSGVSENFHLSSARVITLEEELNSISSTLSGSVAVSSNADIFGQTGYASGIAALIKVALCLYNRYLPCSLHNENEVGSLSNAVKRVSENKCKMFLPRYSVPWVRNEEKGIRNRRYAALSSVSESNSYFYVLLSDEEESHEGRNLFSLDKEASKLFMVKVNNEKDAFEKIAALKTEALKLKTKEEVSIFFKRLLQETLKLDQNTSSGLILCLISTEDVESFVAEVDLAISGIPRSYKLGKNYCSKNGSYLALKPLGKQKVCALYGEGRAPYSGLARDLYRIWPGLHKLTESWTTEMWGNAESLQFSNEEFHSRACSSAEYQKLDMQFEDSQSEKFRSGCFHAMQFTQFAINSLGLQPDSSCGLSLGEISMYFSYSQQNCLMSNQLTDNLANSYVWKSALGGRCTAVTKILGIPEDSNVSIDDVWFGYVFPKSREVIEAAMSKCALQNHLRLMIVNSCDSALVAGSHKALEELIEHLGLSKSMVLPVPQRMVGHCPEVGQCKADISRIHETLEIPPVALKNLNMFTNIGYKPVKDVVKPDNDGTIRVGHLAAEVYEQQADFVKLIEAVANAGNRIFVELGADNQRTLAANNILKKKCGISEAEFVSASINKKGNNDWTNILAFVAILKSHLVPGITLSGIYDSSLLAVPEPTHKMIKDIEINGKFKGLTTSSLKISCGKINTIIPQKFIMSLKVPSKRKTQISTVGPQIPMNIQEKTPVARVSNDVSLALEDLVTGVQKLNHDLVISGHHCVPSMEPHQLGSERFKNLFGGQCSLYLGSMWNGISGPSFVEAAAGSRIVSIYGSYNLSSVQVEKDLADIQDRMSPEKLTFVGCNITHMPLYVEKDAKIFDILANSKLSILEISRFSKITPELLKFRLIRPDFKIIAKVMDIESCKAFLLSAKEAIESNTVIIKKLVASGEVSQDAVDKMSCSDSPFVEAIVCTGSNSSVTILPVVLSLRRSMNSRTIVGVAGNLGCPSAVVAAFDAGAEFISTGSINLLTKEAALSNKSKQALLSLDSTDVAELPTFGLNVLDKNGMIPVVKRGTMFPSRAMKLFELASKYDSWLDIPEEERKKVEAKILKASFDDVWNNIKKRSVLDPLESQRFSFFDSLGTGLEKVKLAVVFGEFLRDAISAEKTTESQIWCGATIGSFNKYNRIQIESLPSVVETNLKLLSEACVYKRLNSLVSLLKFLQPDSSLISDLVDHFSSFL